MLDLVSLILKTLRICFPHLIFLPSCMVEWPMLQPAKEEIRWLGFNTFFENQQPESASLVLPQ